MGILERYEGSELSGNDTGKKVTTNAEMTDLLVEDVGNGYRSFEPGESFRTKDRGIFLCLVLLVFSSRLIYSTAKRSEFRSRCGAPWHWLCYSCWNRFKSVRVPRVLKMMPLLKTAKLRSPETTPQFLKHKCGCQMIETLKTKLGSFCNLV